MSKICIIDYKIGGNVFSVQNSLSALGADSFLSSDPREIQKASKVIFPGVSSFSSTMEQIRKLNLVEVIQEKALSGDPFLGICVGMQVLFEHGVEGSPSAGLGLFIGTVDKFQDTTGCTSLKIPHMGWNQVFYANAYNPKPQNPLFKGIQNGDDFYFVHSYRVEAAQDSAPRSKQNPEIAITDYGTEFISHIWNGERLFACQFHTEKSGKSGLRLLKNFIDL